MKTKLIIALCVVLSGCSNQLSPEQVAEQIKYCESKGMGWFIEMKSNKVPTEVHCVQPGKDWHPDQQLWYTINH